MTCTDLPTIMPSRSTRGITSALVVTALLALDACAGGDIPPSPPATAASPVSAPATERVVGPLSAADAEALATMNDGLKAYIELHTTLERSLPPLSKDASPAQIDKNQRAFELLIRQARTTARRGDIFTPAARPVIIRLLAAVFAAPDGKPLTAALADENRADPIALKLTVNSRYPDTVPLTSMPPQILQTLPKLTEDLEYRFVGDWLILLDTHAHVIADYIDNAPPNSPVRK